MPLSGNMTAPKTKEKWVLYRHERDMMTLTIGTALTLKKTAKGGLSKKAKTNILKNLDQSGLFSQRNQELKLDSATHKINHLIAYMFGYETLVSGKKIFIFNSLGNLLLRRLQAKKINPNEIAKIFLAMLWAKQFPDDFGTPRSIHVYPFRIIFKLLTDDRLDCKLYAFEFAYWVPFLKSIDEKEYEKLVQRLLRMRKLPDPKIKRMYKNGKIKNEHVLVNSVYEWDYYVSNYLVDMGIVNRIENPKFICKVAHPQFKNSKSKPTERKVTRNYVTLNPKLKELCLQFLDKYPFNAKPLRYDDNTRLTDDIIESINKFYPVELLDSIGMEEDDRSIAVSNLPELLRETARAPNSEILSKVAVGNALEDTLVDVFNSFIDLRATGLGGAGRADVEIVYDNKEKFACDAKATGKKLTQIKTRRLLMHRRQIGADYHIIVAPDYTPSVLEDIRSTANYIIKADTLAEYLRQHFDNDIRDISWKEIDDILGRKRNGRDISKDIHELTISKFGTETK
jgi:type II restriction enzyme